MSDNLDILAFTLNKGGKRRSAVRVYFLTLVVLTLFPVLQDHPVRSGRTLHSSPSMHGCMWHHHFWATIEAGGFGGKENARLHNGHYDGW